MAQLSQQLQQDLRAIANGSYSSGAGNTSAEVIGETADGEPIYRSNSGVGVFPKGLMNWARGEGLINIDENSFAIQCSEGVRLSINRTTRQMGANRRSNYSEVVNNMAASVAAQ